MDFISLFFIILTLIVLAYLVYMILESKRIHVLLEIFFILSYSVVLIIFLFPSLLKQIEYILGINSAINFILYLSVFLGYFIIFLLYQKTEDQRIQISRLMREIAVNHPKKKKK